jgi:hypothetical protein
MRLLIASHKRIGRMLQQLLLGIQPAQALTIKHPQNVVYSLHPHTREAITVRCERRSSPGILRD